MKGIRNLAIVVGIIAGSAITPAIAREMNVHGTSHAVSSVSNHVVAGTPRIAVLHHLARPTKKISEDVWLYKGFSETSGAEATKNCNWLVVVFDRGYVRELRLVDSAYVAALGETRGTTVIPAIASSR